MVRSCIYEAYRTSDLALDKKIKITIHKSEGTDFPYVRQLGCNIGQHSGQMGSLGPTVKLELFFRNKKKKLSLPGITTTEAICPQNCHTRNPNWLSC